jgi:hypothetical protein
VGGISEVISMTVACCWLNTAHGRWRITAIADSRASIGATAVTDDTVKLMPIAVKCHETSSFSAEFERFINPYFETELGIGYSGDCFSAFNIVAHFSRAMAQLASDKKGDLPTSAGIAEALKALIDAFFSSAAENTKTSTVQFLLFGYEPDTRQPWVAELTRKHPGATLMTIVNPIAAKDFFCIGDGKNAKGFLGNVKALTSNIQGHARGLVLQAEQDAEFQLALEAAKHEIAQKKIIEEKALELIEDTFVASVGGQLQKLEVYRNACSGIVCQTAGLGHHILARIPSIPPGLHIPIVREMMGRKKR